MAKVYGALFGNSATGHIAGILTFRSGTVTHTVKKRRYSPPPATPRQRKLRDCFRDAKRAHSALPPQKYYQFQRWYVHRDIPWVTFWLNWLRDHPECHGT